MQPCLQRKSKIYYIFWECVCSLRYPAWNLHAPCVICSLPGSTHIFPLYIIESTIFGKKWLLNMKCVFWFALTIYLKHFSFYEEMCEMWSKMNTSSCKAPFIVRLQWNLNFLDKCSKNIQMSNCMKIRPAGAELFLAEVRTDRHDKVNSRFSQFYESA